jgi:hypothetical protein
MDMRMRAFGLFVLLVLVASCEKARSSGAPDGDRPSVAMVIDGRHPRSILEVEAKRLFLTGLERSYPEADLVRVIRCTPLDGLRWECVGYAIAGRTLTEQVGVVVGTTEPDVTTRTADPR